jgi:hypothetical protein
MDPRRFYVITTRKGEHGPYTQEELRAVLDQGLIERQHQLRTSVGTMLGTVASQLPSASQPRARSGMDSGQRRARRFNKLSLLVVIITLLLAGAIAASLRPGSALTIAAPAAPAAPLDAPRQDAGANLDHAAPSAATLSPSTPSAPTVTPTAAPPALPAPAAFVAAPSGSLHRDLLVWDGGELGGGWRAPGPPTLVPARDAHEQRHGNAVVHGHGEGSNFANFGWNWIGWFPADGGTDLSAMHTLIFAIGMVGEPAVESVRIALVSSSSKATSNEIDLVALASNVLDGAWHELAVPLQDMVDGSGFIPSKAWAFKVLTWSQGTRTTDIYLDEIGFAR